jgi:hypothetical protein
VHRVIYDELVRGVIRDESRRRYLEIISGLGDRGAEAIIAGCTEIELLVTGDAAGLPYFPPPGCTPRPPQSWPSPTAEANRLTRRTGRTAAAGEGRTEHPPRPHQPVRVCNPTGA